MAPRMPLLSLAVALSLVAALAACSRAQEPTASPSPDPTDAPTAAPTFDPTLLYQIEYTCTSPKRPLGKKGRGSREEGTRAQRGKRAAP